MTFEEYADTITWRTVAERTKAKAVWHYQQVSIDGLKDELHCARAYNDELIANLKLIEEAIAFELGGEPCGLYEAHKLAKAMIQASSSGQANGE